MLTAKEINQIRSEPTERMLIRFQDLVDGQIENTKEVYSEMLDELIARVRYRDKL